METRWYSYDTGIFEDKIIAENDLDPCNRIVLLGEKEWELKVDKLIPFCKEKGIELVLVHGCGRSEFHDNIYKKLGYDPDKVVYFEMHWPLFTETLISWRFDYTKYQHDFKHPFISLNNQAHFHRCTLIDTLAKHNLVEKGIVTWHNFLGNSKNYNFKYYDKQIRKLPDDFDTKLDSFMLPDIYKECFLDVIGEATHNCPFVTEKTIKPLLLQKPFLALSCKHFHKHLQKLGFKLYDKIFDYSFDEVDDIHERAELLVQNVLRVIDKDYNELYALIKPELEFNMNHILTIKKSKSSVPNIIHEYVEDVKRQGHKKENMYYRLWDMVDNVTIFSDP